MHKVGQNRIYTPYMTVYLVISLLKSPYTNRIYMVLANPNHAWFMQLIHNSALYRVQRAFCRIERPKWPHDTSLLIHTLCPPHTTAQQEPKPAWNAASTHTHTLNSTPEVTALVAQQVSQFLGIHIYTNKVTTQIALTHTEFLGTTRTTAFIIRSSSLVRFLSMMPGVSNRIIWYSCIRYWNRNEKRNLEGNPDTPASDIETGRKRMTWEGKNV